MTSNVFHCKTANIQHRLFLRLHHFLCWLSHHWATEGYNSFKSWKSPWDVRCFDGAFIQSLLWFIPPVTGIQDKPESCHIWDSSLQDHAMWPWRNRMVNEPTLRCSSFLILIAFSLFFFFFASCTACQLHSWCVLRLLQTLEPVCVRGWLQIHLSAIFPAFISSFSFMIPSIIENSRPQTHPPNLPCSPNSKRVQAPRPLPPPQDLNYACRVSVRRRICRDLHNPYSLEHLVWLSSIGRCKCTHGLIKKNCPKTSKIDALQNGNKPDS